MAKESIMERIERWYDWAEFQRIPIKRILIHPDDAAAAPKQYKGLPVVVMSGRAA